MACLIDYSFQPQLICEKHTTQLQLRQRSKTVAWCQKDKANDVYRLLRNARLSKTGKTVSGIAFD